MDPHVPATRPGMAASMVVSTMLFATAHGVSMEAITDATGLTLADCADLDARLPNEALPAIWRLITAANPDRAMSLQLASAAPASFLGALAYGAQFASDLRSALMTFVRYREVLSDLLHADLVEDEHPSSLRISHPMDALDDGAAAEVGIAMGARFVREIVKLDGLVEVHFSHVPFGPQTAYTAWFGVPVLFEQDHNAMLFDTGTLDQRPPARDASLFAYIQAHLDLTSQRLAAPDKLARVRAEISHNAERSDYSAEGLARRMGMSLRVLQRFVGGHDTTVRALLDAARASNARELLSDRRLGVEEVSFLLGYSEERAFRRAFKRLTGTTPAQFRKSLG